jgi:hypothetical protein
MIARRKNTRPVFLPEKTYIRNNPTSTKQNRYIDMELNNHIDNTAYSIGVFHFDSQLTNKTIQNLTQHHNTA